ncbi:MAG: calcium/sodium antiporter [Gemmatimonadetes bacterium]|nr:calcium/sodium antiporter [Gemmatimonadota bacterium]NNM05212.1 calcium/sodium antiporter [Gemmatimonadota bacterium]
MVRGAVGLAKRANVPPIVVALTVVALGTSLPELVVSVLAVVERHPGIVVGNVVGSNIANVLLVAGISAMIFPLAYPGPPVRRDSTVMIGAGVFFSILCFQDALSWQAGLALLVGLGLYLVPTLKEVAHAQKDDDARPAPVAVLGVPTQRRYISLFLIVGAIGLPLGARLVVKGTVEVALELGVSEAIVGLSIVAFATSLPELATTGMAAFRRETEVAVGTIIGSNIFNILAIMGVAAVASPYSIPVPRTFPHFDLPVMLAASLAIAAFAFLKKPIGRKVGIVFTAFYVAYITVMFVLV